MAIETPILCLGLSARHSWKDRVLAGIWLTACTYPIVALALPLIMMPVCARWTYLAVGETFAPVAECALFWAAFGLREERGRVWMWRDLSVIVLANLASFFVGELSGFGDWVFRSVLPE